MKEPSVLDYLKSRLNPWQKEKIQIPRAAETDDEAGQALITPVESLTSEELETQTELRPVEQAEAQVASPAGLQLSLQAPWRTVIALCVALIAQRKFEPPVDSIAINIGLYLAAVLLLGWAYFDGEFSLPTASEVTPQHDPLTYHRNSLIGAVVLAAAAFLLFTDNLFTPLNVSLWVAAMLLFLRSLWLQNSGGSPAWRKLADRFKREPLQVSVTRWTLLLIAVALVIVFFRFYRLDGVIGEPFSDHAEKLLDVYDVTQGQTHIFFPRNTGREFIQFYLTAIIASVLGTGLSFISLKIGTALIGLVALPYTYLIGREVGGKRVALFALVLAGTSYWLNTISRIGLRFPLYPALAAPAIYHLIRGLRRQNRNDFILSGLFLGFGLNGYSPYRLVPFLIVLGVGIYLLHRQSKEARGQSMMMLSVLVLASFLVFLPLMRYAIENPSMFSYRAMSRLTGEEQALNAPAWQIFLSNTANAMKMFNYDDGEIWVHSIPHRPALDIVSGALFIFGFIFLFVRYLRKRDWLDLFLMLSVPVLMLPSILSLAFPAENPSLNRTGGAAVIVFVIAGMALDGIYCAVRGAQKNSRQGLAVILAVALLATAALQSYNLVFDQFATQFLRGAWNTSDMGKVIRSFVAAGNNPDNAFVVPFPYWVDTRLVGIQAGYPTRDYALWRNDLPKTETITGSKLFIVKEEDKDTLTALHNLYPSGMLGHFTSPIEGKNFWIYTVPDNQTVNP